MATARIQPSGMWKVRVYSHSDEKGKHYRSFTAPTKQEAEQMASKFSGTADRFARNNITINEAVEGYILAKEGVLSPSTVRGYRSLQQYFAPIGMKKIQKVKSVDIQSWISDLAGRLSPKTVSNIYGLLTASVALYDPDIHFRVKLPAKKKKRSQGASDSDVMMLFNAASRNLKKAIAISAFTSARRGEVCAIKYGDIDGNTAHIHADMVRGVNGWHLKETPKTSDSDRYITFPSAVVDLIGTGDPDEFVVPITPDTITECFGRLRDSLGLSLKFHDLRKYFASIAAVLNVPDTYTESFGGWRPGSKVMKEVYQKNIQSESDRYAKMMSDHFDKIASQNTSSKKV